MFDFYELELVINRYAVYYSFYMVLVVKIVSCSTFIHSFSVENLYRKNIYFPRRLTAFKI